MDRFLEPLPTKDRGKNRTAPRVRRSAFTLAELPLSALVASLVLMGLAAVAYHCVETLRYVEDLRASHIRAERVFSILRVPLEHCGYGMPADAEEYKRAFSGLALPPFNWDGPFSVTFAMVGARKRENATCRIVYGVFALTRTSLDTCLSGDVMNVTATGLPYLLERPHTFAPPTSVKNWLLFGAMSPTAYPLWQNGVAVASSDGTIIPLKLGSGVSPAPDTFVPENDELHYLRALGCNAGLHPTGDFVFFTDDHTGSGKQPRVEGIVDARFEWDKVHNLVTVYLLVRGENRYDRMKTIGAVKNWPTAYDADIAEEARRYRLFVHKLTCELKNF